MQFIFSNCFLFVITRRCCVLNPTPLICAYALRIHRKRILNPFTYIYCCFAQLYPCKKSPNQLITWLGDIPKIFQVRKFNVFDRNYYYFLIAEGFSVSRVYTSQLDVKIVRKVGLKYARFFRRVEKILLICFCCVLTDAIWNIFCIWIYLVEIGTRMCKSHIRISKLYVCLFVIQFFCEGRPEF